MNASPKRRPNAVKPIIAAVALALSGSVYAASMDDVVKTRADQNIDQQYGRDSVYAFSIDAKPLKPEQQGTSSDAGIFDKAKSYAANAWDSTRNFAGNVWDKTTALVPHSSTTAVQHELQPYGRAGGYVGADRIAVLESSDSLAANSQYVVRPGTEHGNVADVRRSDKPIANAHGDASPDSMQDEARIEGSSAALPSKQSALEPDQSAMNQSADEVSATDSSGYTKESDPEHMPNDAVPLNDTGDMSATEGSGYTDEADPERMPN